MLSPDTKSRYFLFGVIVGSAATWFSCEFPPYPSDRMGDARATIAAATQAVAVADMERQAATAAAAVATKGAGE
jgi:hypothetical protein